MVNAVPIAGLRALLVRKGKVELTSKENRREGREERKGMNLS